MVRFKRFCFFLWFDNYITRCQNAIINLAISVYTKEQLAIGGNETKSNQRTKPSAFKENYTKKTWKWTQDTLPQNRGGRKERRLAPTQPFLLIFYNNHGGPFLASWKNKRRKGWKKRKIVFLFICTPCLFMAFGLSFTYLKLRALDTHLLWY